MNVGSVYQFGAFVSDDDIGGITGNTFAVVTEGDPSDMSGGQDSLESALAIVNQSAEDLSATIDFELNANISGDTEYVFELQSSRDGSDTREGLSTSPITGTLTARLNTGESIGLSFIVNALEATTADKLSGSLSISATTV